LRDHREQSGERLSVNREARNYLRLERQRRLLWILAIGVAVVVTNALVVVASV